MSSPHDEKLPPGKAKSAAPNIEEYQLGVWLLRLDRDRLLGKGKLWDSIRKALPLYYNLILEIYRIAPRLFTLFILTQIWQGVEDALQMQFSSRVLKAVSTPDLRCSMD